MAMVTESGISPQTQQSVQSRAQLQTQKGITKMQEAGATARQKSQQTHEMAMMGAQQSFAREQAAQNRAAQVADREASERISKLQMASNEQIADLNRQTQLAVSDNETDVALATGALEAEALMLNIGLQGALAKVTAAGQFEIMNRLVSNIQDEGKRAEFQLNWEKQVETLDNQRKVVMNDVRGMAAGLDVPITGDVDRGHVRSVTGPIWNSAFGDTLSYDKATPETVNAAMREGKITGQQLLRGLVAINTILSEVEQRGATVDKTFPMFEYPVMPGKPETEKKAREVRRKAEASMLKAQLDGEAKLLGELRKALIHGVAFVPTQMSSEMLTAKEFAMGESLTAQWGAARNRGEDPMETLESIRMNATQLFDTLDDYDKRMQDLLHRSQPAQVRQQLDKMRRERERR